MPVITGFQGQTIWRRWIQRFQFPVAGLSPDDKPILILFEKELINGC